MVDHILNIISPVDFSDIRDVAPREGELDAKQTHRDPTNNAMKTEIREEVCDVEKFLKQVVENRHDLYISRNRRKIECHGRDLFASRH